MELINLRYAETVDAMVLASQPAIFCTTFIDFRRPLEKDSYWPVAVYYIDGFWTAY